MYQIRNISILVVALVSTAGTLSPDPAQARERGHVVHGHGPGGNAHIRGRHVSREPGSVKVTRGAVTRGGHGYRQTRQTTRGDGTLSNNVERRYRNGKTMTRSSSVTRNGDGSVSRERGRTGPAGNSQGSWSTIYRTDDGYTRNSGASTSRGRGYSATRDVSVAPGSVTVSRKGSTNSGRSIDQTRTYTRPN
ncbi:MAG TPA: hypothetical protein VEZ59_06205 [Sphingopyxis sp.]|nr:hypothetical protein [Sphingopyxis sp.]